MRTRIAGATSRLQFVAFLLPLLLFACARATPPEFRNTFDSKEAVAHAVLDALWQRDVERLTSLAVSEAEFRKYVWPELPATRAGVGGSPDYWWDDLRTRSLASMALVLDTHGGRRLEFEAVSFEGDAASYGTFTVHREALVTVRNEAGAVEEVRLFGSLIETPTGWKVYSYVID